MKTEFLNRSLDISNFQNIDCRIGCFSDGIKRKMGINEKFSTISKKLKLQKINEMKKEKVLDLGGYDLIISPKSEKSIETKEEFDKIAKKEYIKVNKATPFLTNKMNFEEKTIKFPTATLFENYRKNRYNDVLCNEKTRFLFKLANSLSFSMANISFDEPTNQCELIDEKKYINANYIKGTHNYNSTFIATQAPLEETLPEFFEMIWQSKSKMIITLSSIIEAGRVKMFQFWPEKNKTLEISHFNISIEEEINGNNGLVIRKLSVTNLSCEMKRTIIQIHFTGWPDNGVPQQPSSLVEIYKYQKLFEEEGKKEDLDGPAIVHCSAGIGRTATYISFVFASQIIENIKKTGINLDKSLLNSQINIPEIVINIRKQRSGSVQNWEQYQFVYKALNYYLKQLSN